MNRFGRLLIAGLLVVSGLALVPYVGFPAERFNWQQFAGAYDPQPTLAVNHQRGHRDSFFAITGEHFLPNSTVRIDVNGRQLGTATADRAGKVAFVLGTDRTDEGFYVVRANQAGSTRFWVDNAAPRWPAAGAGPTYEVPEGIGFTFFRHLPLMGR
ncbi:MAG TPA: hypothetical protein VGE07_00250 [Herpetosiphonaceae bacterium]